MVSFKGVFLEGVEVVFIVVTFGLSADALGLAIAGAIVAGIIVIALGVALRKPLARIPENTLKYGVGVCSRRSAPSGRSRASATSAQARRACTGLAASSR